MRLTGSRKIIQAEFCEVQVHPCLFLPIPILDWVRALSLDRGGEISFEWVVVGVHAPPDLLGYIYVKVDERRLEKVSMMMTRSCYYVLTSFESFAFLDGCVDVCCVAIVGRLSLWSAHASRVIRSASSIHAFGHLRSLKYPVLYLG